MKSKSLSDDSFEPESSGGSDTPSKEGSPEESIKLSRELDYYNDCWEPSIKNISLPSPFDWRIYETVGYRLLQILVQTIWQESECFYGWWYIDDVKNRFSLLLLS